MSVSGIWMSGYCDLRGISKELPLEWVRKKAELKST